MAKLNTWNSVNFSWMVMFVFLQMKLVCTLSPPSFNRSELIKYINSETEVADNLLVGYDKRFIPTQPGMPLNVKLEIVISDVLRIENMEAEMTIFIRQTWYDYRLSWNSTKRLKVREHFLDKIWLPDVRIINLKDAKRFEGFGGVNMNIYPNGRIYFSQLIHIITSCPMDLHRFPMDRQTCFLNFSTFAYGSDLLNFTGAGEGVDVRHSKLPQFYFVEAKEIEEVKGTKFTVSLTFQRRAGYYILQVYIPASFLVVLSWLSFFMEATNIADRLALEITMILSTVFLLDSISDSVIHVSYAKASDWFVIISFGFIFVALLETMLVYRLSSSEGTQNQNHSVKSELNKQLSIVFMKANDNEDKVEEKLRQQAVLGAGREEIEYQTDSDMTINTLQEHITNASTSKQTCRTSSWIDKICIFLFPMMYIGFNLGYWFYYLPK